MQAPYGGIPQGPTTNAPKKYDGKNGVPLYDSAHGGHYGASAHIATQGHAPPPETFTGHWQNVTTSFVAEFPVYNCTDNLRRYHKA